MKKEKGVLESVAGSSQVSQEVQTAVTEIVKMQPTLKNGLPEVAITAKNAPEKKIKVGNIQVAIWRNKSKSDDTFYSVSFERYYKDGELWKSTTSLNKNDIPKAILALEEAYKFLMVKRTGKEIIEDHVGHDE